MSYDVKFVLCLFPKGNGYFQVCALVTELQGGLCLLSLDQHFSSGCRLSHLSVELVSHWSREAKLIQEGRRREGKRWRREMVYVQKTYNKPPLDTGIDIKMIDNSFLPLGVPG